MRDEVSLPPMFRNASKSHEDHTPCGVSPWSRLEKCLYELIVCVCVIFVPYHLNTMSILPLTELLLKSDHVCCGDN